MQRPPRHRTDRRCGGGDQRAADRGRDGHIMECTGHVRSTALRLTVALFRALSEVTSSKRVEAVSEQLAWQPGVAARTPDAAVGEAVRLLGWSGVALPEAGRRAYAWPHLASSPRAGRPRWHQLRRRRHGGRWRGGLRRSSPRGVGGDGRDPGSERSVTRPSDAESSRRSSSTSPMSDVVVRRRGVLADPDDAACQSRGRTRVGGPVVRRPLTPPKRGGLTNLALT